MVSGRYAHLADWQMVKSVVDAFIMSLHYYEGDQLDQVSERIKDKFGGEAAYWRDLLLNRSRRAWVSACAVYQAVLESGLESRRRCSGAM
jgi:hypothetical protein